MKNNYTFLATLFVIIGLGSVKAQNLLNTNSSTLKKGIYKNFEEFKNNSPSMDLEYTILSKQKDTGGVLNRLITNGKTSFYYLDISKEQTKEIGKIYGFSDGKNVYINEFNPKLKPSTLFMKVNFISEFCLFEYQPYTSIESLRHRNRVMNMNTKKITRMSRKKLQELIKKEMSYYYNTDIDIRVSTLTKVDVNNSSIN